jgi:hypothetical protein
MFSRHCRVLESLLAAESTSEPVIERHLNELIIRWNALQEAHDLYAITCLTGDTDYDSSEKFIDTYTVTFIRIESECDKLMLKTPQRCSGASCDTQGNSIKLERIKFRKFDGDVRTYPKFKAEFIKYVAPLCSESQQTFVLKSYLCESVRREVENIDHNIDTMWSRLDEKYGAVHKLIDCILSDIKNLPSCDDSLSALEMIRLVETAHSDLKCIDALNELHNATIISVIEERMSKSMLDEWVKLVAGKELSSDAKFCELLPFLHQWKRMIEYQNADIRMQTIQGDLTDYCATSTSRRCLVHRDAEHPIWRCRSFRAMSIKERQDVIIANNACTLCLETGHNVTSCKRTFRCTMPGCNAAHNVLLHTSAR